MKTNLIMLLLLLSGFAVKSQTAPAPANTNPNPSATSKSFASPGCVELGGSFSFTSQSFTYPNGGGTSPATTVMLFAPYVGYFPVKGFELGLNPFSIESISNGSGGNTTSLLFIFAPSYNFNTHSIVYPFIEGNIGYNSKSIGTSTETGACFGARAGVKLAIATHALVDLGVQYLVQNYSSDGITYPTINNLVIGIGFTVNL